MKQRRSGKTDGNKWERVREKMREFLLWYYNAFNKTNTIPALCRQTIVRFEIENAFKSHWVRASGKRSISQRISLFAFSVDKSQTKWLQMDRHKLCNSVHYLQRHNKNKFTIQNKTITSITLYMCLSLSLSSFHWNYLWKETKRWMKWKKSECRAPHIYPEQYHRKAQIYFTVRYNTMSIGSVFKSRQRITEKNTQIYAAEKRTNSNVKADTHKAAAGAAQMQKKRANIEQTAWNIFELVS